MMKIKLLPAVLIFLFFISGCGGNQSVLTYKEINFVPSQEQNIFLDTLQYRSFLYFLNEMNPENGLVRDRTADWSPASIAAVGFAYPVWAIGAEKGWITREFAAELTRKSLLFFLNSEHSTDTLATGYNGFYYHFLDMQTGKRAWRCELSSIDTGLLFAGIIFARNYYNGGSETEKDIRSLSDRILGKADWSFFQLPDTGKHRNTFSMSWHPEKPDQIGSHGWTGYNEALIIFILAAGSGMQNIDAAYTTWLDHYEWKDIDDDKSHYIFPPMFGHQYTHMFVDFRGIADRKISPKGIDYFENSRRATYVQRDYAIENPLNWKGYDSLTWGFTASDGPGSSYNSGDRKFESYGARGVSGKGIFYLEDGTIAPTALGGSVPFAPEITIPSLMHIYKTYGQQGLWGEYGFFDSFNPELNWINSDYLGIDQGPIVIMIENYRTGFVWDYVMKDPIIKKGLARLGFMEI